MTARVGYYPIHNSMGDGVTGRAALPLSTAVGEVHTNIRFVRFEG